MQNYGFTLRRFTIVEYTTIYHRRLVKKSYLNRILQKVKLRVKFNLIPDRTFKRLASNTQHASHHLAVFILVDNWYVNFMVERITF